MKLERKYLIGLLTYSGLLIPYFAKSFTLFGLHNRLLGNVLLLMALLLGLKYAKWTQKSTNILLMIIVFYIFTLVIYSSPIQISNLVSFSFDRLPYYDNKLAMIIFLYGAPIITSFVLSGIAHEESFKNGFVHAMGVLSVLAIIVSINSSEYWVAVGDYGVKSQKQDLAVFSSINMTTIHLSGLFFSVAYILKRKYVPINLIIFLGSAIFIVLYRQRSAWVYIPAVMVGFFLILSDRNILKMINNTLLLTVLIIAGVILTIYSGVITNAVVGYWNLLAEGKGLYTRMPGFKYAWNSFLNYPYGHGLGAFALAAPVRGDYPHNIILEALYELGVVGGLFVLAILYNSLKSIKKLLSKLPKRSDDKAVKNLIISALFGYLIFVSLKAGDLVSIEVLIAFTILFSAHQKRRRINVELS